MASRSGTASTSPSAYAASRAVHAAAASAHVAINRCGTNRSGRPRVEEVTAPTAKPIWTDAVSQTAAVALRSHSVRRVGEIAVAENQTASPRICTPATRASCGRALVGATPPSQH